MTSRSTNYKNSRMNYNFQNESFESKANKPTREASSILEVLVLMIVHICKKVLFFDTNLKIAVYLGALFLISLMADSLTFPKTYFSRSDNIFNQYFVKIGWFWTLFMTVPYVLLTSYTTCCGNRKLIATAHLSRLAIATFFWYTWTMIFNVIETKYGRCNMKNVDNKVMCLKNGGFWNGFDISGHCFILIYSSLVMIEEARAINGWERIKDYIRDEKHARSIDDKSVSLNPLRKISAEELEVVKTSYEKWTPYVRGFLIATTLLHILWDVMLVSTILYYHIMVEKFISGVIAIFTWFVTYRVWYTIPNVLPNLPGDGTFKYNKTKLTSTPTFRKRSTTNGKHFMGMPINRQDATEAATEEKR
ncbi:acyl-coenzyme A diphosphatase FITM2 [Leguminivora glycinivorella]|uniref:acyl-coenzyme A diphosphatase FITM2 n=1 Tax=Leguminivora glycinivorella TaxID=1035111 RepID=UPI00200F696B|nr:acyl-coenzyme A diphosphatase FITM2 [Leguminivora glycinivorella]